MWSGSKKRMIKIKTDEWMPDIWNCESFKKISECGPRCLKINIVNIKCWVELNSFEPPQKLKVVISNADH